MVSWVHILQGISIGSSVFAGLTVVTEHATTVTTAAYHTCSLRTVTIVCVFDQPKYKYWTGNWQINRGSSRSRKLLPAIVSKCYHACSVVHHERQQKTQHHHTQRYCKHPLNCLHDIRQLPNAIFCLFSCWYHFWTFPKITHLSHLVICRLVAKILSFKTLY